MNLMSGARGEKIMRNPIASIGRDEVSYGDSNSHHVDLYASMENLIPELFPKKPQINKISVSPVKSLLI